MDYGQEDRDYWSDKYDTEPEGCADCGGDLDSNGNCEYECMLELEEDDCRE